MSLKIDRLQLEIVINNDQARKSLRSLEDESRKLTREMSKLDKTSQAYADKANQLRNIKIQMDNIYESIGITNLSMRELRNRQQELNAVMSHMNPNLAEYKKLELQQKAVTDRINELKGKAKDTGLSLSKMADGFNKYFAMATAGVATLTGVIFSLRRVVDVANLFEKRVDNLSALTGLMGRDLEYLSQEAIDMSTAVVEGNIRITSSANEIVDAYTKVGSKRPELLAVKEDLADVTKEAMILAAAADGELDPAVAALTMVLNQFNLPADEARRIINVLAAGSKVGAGEVDYLTAAFEKSGSVASMLDVSIEELTGNIETLAARITEPEMAGRSLRNIMIKLEEQTDDKLKPSLVGLTQSFVNLRDKQLDVTALSKMFGEENINAATILMRNTEETLKYTSAVTGTNVALEQAAKNTDNNQSKLDQARNRVQALSIEFGQKLAPAMTFSTNVFAAFMRVALAAPDFIRRYQIAIIALTGALIAYNAVQIKNLILFDNLIARYIRNTIVLNAMVATEKLRVIWTTQSTIATKLATTAQLAWNTAIKASPIGWVIAGITALITAIKLYDRYNADSVRLEQEKADALKQVTEAIKLYERLFDKQKEQINDLNKLSYEQKKALMAQTDEIIKQAEAELVLAKARRLRIIEDSKPTVWQTLSSRLNAGWATKGVKERGDKSIEIFAGANAIENTKELTQNIDALSDSIKQFKELRKELSETVSAEKLGDMLTGNLSVSQLEEKQRYYQTALKNYEKGSNDYIRIAKKLGEVNRKLNSDNSDDTKDVITKYEELSKKVSDFDKQILAAITANNLPLAEKLSIERAAAVELKDAIDEVKKALDQGWDLSQRDLPELEKMIGKSATNILSGKKKDSPLLSRKDIKSPEVPVDIQEQEKLEQQLAQDWIDTKYNMEVQLNQSLTNIVKDRLNWEHEHKLNLLEKERDAELNNKNLTEEQKKKINDKYDAKIRAEKQRAWRKQQLADASSTTIATILAVMKAGGPQTPTGAIAAAAGALGVIEILAQKVPEFARGKYLVTGQQTGNKYVTDYTGPARTGMYTKPSLIGMVGERGSEMVIDHATTRNLQMNYPEVINAINYARVPQFASGKYVSTQTGSGAAPEATSPFTPYVLETMNRFADSMDRLQRDGIRGDWSLFDLEKIQNDKSSLQSATEM